MDTDQLARKVYMYDPVWLPVYTMFCVLGSFPFLLVTVFGIGVSVTSDIVFGMLVALGGPLGDFVFRIVFKKIIYFLPKVNIELIYMWPVIGLIIIIVRPFET